MSRLNEWTLAQALDVCREIEHVIAPVGFHVGLRGSLLLNGESNNDLDLIIYPHDSTSVCLDNVYDALYSIGVVQLKTKEQVHARWRAKGSTDEKHIEIWGYVRRKVDILFVGIP